VYSYYGYGAAMASPPHGRPSQSELNPKVTNAARCFRLLQQN